MDLRDDKGDALGFLVERRAPATAPRLLGLTGIWLRPLLKVLQGVKDGSDEMGNLGDGAFDAGLVQVGKKRILKRGVVVLDHTRELQELLPAVLERARHARLERLLQAGVYLQMCGVA